jgi:hypothetical protein
MTFYNDTKKQSRAGARLIIIYHPFQFVFYISLIFDVLVFAFETNHMSIAIRIL